MKKILWLLLLLIPFYVFAYSKYIIPGGDTLGIEVNSKGVVVVGFYDVNGERINRNLRIGDKILKVNNIEVNNANELSKLLVEYMDNNIVDITYSRNNKEYNTDLKLVYNNGNYKSGIYVKSNVLGIGTLTYIDPNSSVYGVLGHSLNLSQTNQLLEVKSGYSYDAYVTSFTKSNDGNPGSKNASIDKNEIFGSINNNTKYGVFGIVNNIYDRELLEVGQIDDIKVGKAYIRTTDKDNEITSYEIKILEVNKNNSDKNIYFEVIDKDLLSMSGGIVQGMSGSPIIQDNKIIGAVTRVLIDDVSKGYGISIVTMLEEGDKLLQ
ncbi:MAG: SpoIVB peptidase S55 domain-containing protein [Candidatus Coprovivens sp.]